MMGTLVAETLDDTAAPTPSGIEVPDFGARLLGLTEVFDGHAFVVPDYQRGYAWGEREVTDLLNDIEQQFDSGAHRHYTGTLVLTRPAQGEPGLFHVVDGQQRLTTLVLLMAQIATRLEPAERAQMQARYLVRGETGAETSVLRLNSDAHPFFWNRLLRQGSGGETPVTLATHERLLDAWQRIGAWLDAEQAPSAAAVRAAVERRLGFLVYTPAEDVETGVMFEVINNRGKPLSELEKVKNYLIYSAVRLSAPSLRREVDESWSSVLRNLSMADRTSAAEESAFLRYCLVVHSRLSKNESRDGYEEVKGLVSVGCLKDAAEARATGREAAISWIRSFVAFLKDASAWYARLFGMLHEDVAPELRPLLVQLRAQANLASVMPLFLAIVIRSAKPNEQAELLRWLEIVNFRVYIARNVTARADTGQAELYGLASGYYHGTLKEQLTTDDHNLAADHLGNLQALLQYRMVKFALTHSPDERFRDSFVLDGDDAGDFFNWSGLRYFLVNYEQDLQPNKTIAIDRISNRRADGKSGDYLSVEHLWATGYRAAEGENDRPVDQRERRRLGNFALLELRLNIQGGNQFIKDKVAHYLGEGEGAEPPTDLEQVRQAARIAKRAVTAADKGNPYKSKNYYLGIHRTINDKREEKFIEFASGRWSIADHPSYKALARHRASEDLE